MSPYSLLYYISLKRPSGDPNTEGAGEWGNSLASGHAILYILYGQSALSQCTAVQTTSALQMWSDTLWQMKSFLVWFNSYLLFIFSEIGIVYTKSCYTIWNPPGWDGIIWSGHWHNSHFVCKKFCALNFEKRPPTWLVHTAPLINPKKICLVHKSPVPLIIVIM